MAPDCGVDLHRISECCAAVISYSANLMLIMLIAFRTSAEIRVYSRALLVNCVADLLLTTTSFVIEVHWLISDGYMFIFHNGFVRTDSPGDAFFVTGIYLFSLYIAILSLTVPFIYRYCLICRNYVLKGLPFGMLVLFCVAFASMLPLSCRIFLYDDMQDAFVADPNITERLPCRHTAQIPYMNINFTLQTVIPMLVLTTIGSYTYSVVGLCSYKIWKELKSKADQLSRKTASLNRQLNRMLLVQALSPFAVVVIPLLATCIVVYTGSKEAESLAYVNTALSWIPVITPLSTMYFVKEYRNTILTAVRMPSVRIGDSSDGTAGSATPVGAH